MPTDSGFKERVGEAAEELRKVGYPDVGDDLTTVALLAALAKEFEGRE